MSVWEAYAEAAKTSVGFFWKAGWAFVLGYAVSAMIQAFVPKGRLTPLMGDASPRSVSLATFFGAASSSCSFAALAAARSLVMKGAHFVAAVAFMFASTNLVIELGILILIFLGWQYLAAEIVGGLLLVVVSTTLIRLTYPRAWLEAARERVERQGDTALEDFDWRERLTSFEGWTMVGRNFVSDWRMVWEE
ncbi:MAG: permease, partial [Gemmatimonadota bacterium]|nr:permease [Gemmatimonadota bacterium]